MKCIKCSNLLTSGDLNGYCFRCTQEIDQASTIQYQEMLSIKLSKHVHDKCENVPHDIGLSLIEIVISHLRF